MFYFLVFAKQVSQSVDLIQFIYKPKVFIKEIRRAQIWGGYVVYHKYPLNALTSS